MRTSLRQQMESVFDIEHDIRTAKTVDATTLHCWLNRINAVGRKVNGWIITLIKPDILEWIDSIDICLLLRTIAQLQYQDTELFDQCSCMVLNTEYNLNELVIIAGSFAKLGYVDGCFWEMIIGRIMFHDMFGHFEIPKIFKALALVGIKYMPLVNKLKAETMNTEFTASEAIAIMWSMAVLELRWIGAYKYLVKFVSGTLTSGLRTQLYHTYLWLHYVVGVKLPMGVDHKKHRKSKYSTQSSPGQMEVITALTKLGYKVTVETHIWYISIDVMVKVRGVNKAIEFDGPTHYLWQSLRPTGRSLLKRRILSALIPTVFIPWWEWPKDDTERLNYLRDRL